MSRSTSRGLAPDEVPPADAGDGPPAPARPSSTVAILRPGAGGFETFMLRRDARSRFAADMWVFPGGALDPDDAHPELLRRSPGLDPDEAFRRLAERGGEAPESPASAFGLHLAALRELFEEAGVLLGTPREDGPGAPIGEPAADEVAAGRAALEAGTLGFVELVRDLDLVLRPERLVYFAHWITPRILPRRFDTRFFAVELPSGQEAIHCGVETTDGAWMTPSAALGRAAAGEIKLMQPTEAVLRAFARSGSAEDAIVWAASKEIRSVHPTHGPAGWSLNVAGDAW